MHQPNVVGRGPGVLNAYKIKCCNFPSLQGRPTRRIGEIRMIVSKEKAFVDDSPSDFRWLFL